MTEFDLDIRITTPSGADATPESLFTRSTYCVTWCLNCDTDETCDHLPNTICYI